MSLEYKTKSGWTAWSDEATVEMLEFLASCKFNLNDIVRYKSSGEPLTVIYQHEDRVWTEGYGIIGTAHLEYIVRIDGGPEMGLGAAKGLLSKPVLEQGASVYVKGWPKFVIAQVGDKVWLNDDTIVRRKDVS